MEKREVEGLFLCQLSNYLWDFGYYIDKRSHENLTLHLYSVESKYYEIHYNRESIIVKISETGLEDICKFYGSEISAILNPAPQLERKV
jgi:hypothetical protein